MQPRTGSERRTEESGTRASPSNRGILVPGASVLLRKISRPRKKAAASRKRGKAAQTFLDRKERERAPINDEAPHRKERERTPINGEARKRESSGARTAADRKGARKASAQKKIRWRNGQGKASAQKGPGCEIPAKRPHKEGRAAEHRAGRTRQGSAAGKKGRAKKDRNKEVRRFLHERTVCI